MQINNAARRRDHRREQGEVMGKLTNDLQIRFKVYKTTITEEAKIRVEDAAAIAPDKATPSGATVAAGVAALALLRYICQNDECGG
ncbi:MAG: hypothetical protein P4L33_12455 [Capsulimonadaceae bacterium]|nr:hypothetical protein [Capsulimonadaceae bacterium]